MGWPGHKLGGRNVPDGDFLGRGVSSRDTSLTGDEWDMSPNIPTGDDMLHVPLPKKNSPVSACHPVA